MRLFIALPVPEDVRRALTETQDALRKRGVRGRFTRPENLHMTLVFLGNAPDPAPVIAAIKSARLPRETLRFERLTFFGDALVGLYQPNSALSAYVKTLGAALSAAGLPFDRQAFRPHITLCRKTALPAADFRLYPFERKLKSARLPVKEARLFRSDLSGPEPRYTILFAEGAKL